MKAGSSKKKGSSFERACAKLLSLWITDGKSEDALWRSSLSGGRATIAHRKGRGQQTACGDICSVSPEGHALTDVFFVECKHLKNISLNSFLLENKGPLAGIWLKCQQQAADHKRCPMLLVKENNRLAIVITLPGHLDDVCEAKGSITLYPEIRPFNTMLGYKFKIKV